MEKLFQNNTYGICSINSGTFNPNYHGPENYPKKSRDIVITVLKAHNLLLLIGGYTGKFKMITGSMRMLTGAGMLATTLALGDRNTDKGAIVGKFCDEALVTGAAQMMRGGLEAYVPYGRIVNVALDAVATILNLLSYMKGIQESDNIKNTGASIHPHQQPKYSPFLWPLNFA